MVIEYEYEASDAFRRAVADLPEYGVTLTLEDDGEGAEEVEAILLGPDPHSTDLGAVLFIRAADGDYDRASYPGVTPESAVVTKIVVS